MMIKETKWCTGDRRGTESRETNTGQERHQATRESSGQQKKQQLDNKQDKTTRKERHQTTRKSIGQHPSCDAEGRHIYIRQPKREKIRRSKDMFCDTTVEEMKGLA